MNISDVYYPLQSNFKGITIRDKIALEAMKKLIEKGHTDEWYISNLSYKIANEMVKRSNE